MAWICASGIGTLLRKPSRAPLMVLSGELHSSTDPPLNGSLNFSCLDEAEGKWRCYGLTDEQRSRYATRHQSRKLRPSPEEGGWMKGSERGCFSAEVWH